MWCGACWNCVMRAECAAVAHVAQTQPDLRCAEVDTFASISSACELHHALRASPCLYCSEVAGTIPFLHRPGAQHGAWHPWALPAKGELALKSSVCLYTGQRCFPVNPSGCPVPDSVVLWTSGRMMPNTVLRGSVVARLPCSPCEEEPESWVRP